MAHTRILIKTEFNWADEMDIYGFTVMTPAQYQYLMDRIKASEYPADWYVGTNEEITFESADEVFKGFDVSVITVERAEFLEKHFLRFGEYGQTPFDVLCPPNEWYEKNPHPEKEKF